MCKKGYSATPSSSLQHSGPKYQEILLGRAIHAIYLYKNIVYLYDNSVRPDPYLTDTP